MGAGRCSLVVDGDPDAVFRTLTHIDRLPEWNTVIEAVVERPSVLQPGEDWVVRLHAMGSRWNSRSTVETLDPQARRFSYRSRTDDGNPSYADWAWTITPDPGGSRVEVSWDVHPKTFWRRVLLSKIRARQLARELPASITALAQASRAAGTAAHGVQGGHMTHPNAEILRRSDEAMEAGDIDGFFSFYADDVLVHAAGQSFLAGTYKGKDELRELFGRFMEAVGDYTFENHAHLADDEYGVTIQRARAERNGKTMELDEVFVMRFCDGKISEMWYLPTDQARFDAWIE